MKILETIMYGNDSCLREICHKIDPTYEFPVEKFGNIRFGESGPDYDRGGALHLSFTLIDGNLKIVSHREAYLHNGASCRALHAIHGSPGFERLV